MAHNGGLFTLLNTSQTYMGSTDNESEAKSEANARDTVCIKKQGPKTRSSNKRRWPHYCHNREDYCDNSK